MSETNEEGRTRRSKNAFLILLDIRNLEKKRNDKTATEHELDRLNKIDKLFDEYEMTLIELNRDFLKEYNDKCNEKKKEPEKLEDSIVIKKTGRGKKQRKKFVKSKT